VAIISSSATFFRHEHFATLVRHSSALGVRGDLNRLKAECCSVGIVSSLRIDAVARLYAMQFC
jgi:hypothetical protein